MEIRDKISFGSESNELKSSVCSIAHLKRLRMGQTSWLIPANFTSRHPIQVKFAPSPKRSLTSPLYPDSSAPARIISSLISSGRFVKMHLGRLRSVDCRTQLAWSTVARPFVNMVHAGSRPFSTSNLWISFEAFSMTLRMRYGVILGKVCENTTNSISLESMHFTRRPVLIFSRNPQVQKSLRELTYEPLVRIFSIFS